LKNINSDLDIENSDLKSRIERMEVQNKISDQLRNQLNKSKDHYDRLLEQSKIDIENKINELEKDYELKEAEIKRKYKEIDNMNKKEMLNTITSIQKDLEGSNLGYEKIKISNNDLRNEIKILQQQNRDIKQELDQKDNENEKNILEINNKYDFILKNISDEADNLRCKNEKLINDIENKNLQVMKLEDSIKYIKNNHENEKNNYNQK